PKAHLRTPRRCPAQAPTLLATGNRQLPLSDPNRLRVHELADAVRSQFSPVAGLLHAAERNARIGGDHLVNEYHPSFEFVDEALALLVVVGPCARALAKAHVVGYANRLILILHAEDRGHGAEEFLAVRRRVFRNVGQDRGLMIISLALQGMAPGQKF